MTTERVIGSIADVLGIGTVLLAWLGFVRLSIQKYLFLFAIFASGIAIGLAIPGSDWLLAVVGIVLLIVLCFLSTKPWFDRAMLGGAHVAIGRRAYFNLFCETIHRVCLALGDGQDAGNDVRAALFHVDSSKRIVEMVGRYPIEQGDDDRVIIFAFGRGIAGTCASAGKPIIVEGLPKWENHLKEYVEIMGDKFCLAAKEVEGLHRKSRSYYNFPILTRNPCDGVRQVKYVFCVDSIYEHVGINHSREQIVKVLSAIGENSIQLLEEDKIGF